MVFPTRRSQAQCSLALMHSTVHVGQWIVSNHKAWPCRSVAKGSIDVMCKQNKRSNHKAWALVCLYYIILNFTSVCERTSAHVLWLLLFLFAHYIILHFTTLLNKVHGHALWLLTIQSPLIVVRYIWVCDGVKSSLALSLLPEVTWQQRSIAVAIHLREELSACAGGLQTWNPSCWLSSVALGDCC